MPETRLLGGEAGPCEAIAFNIYKLCLTTAGNYAQRQKAWCNTDGTKRERETEKWNCDDFIQRPCNGKRRQLRADTKNRKKQHGQAAGN